MAKSKEAPPKKSHAPVIPDRNEPPPSTGSKFKKGGGSARVTRRNIVIYGPPKTLKTTSASTLPLGRTKWIISDSNSVPTLEALGRTPHPDDLYECKSLKEAHTIVREMLEYIDTNGPDSLGFDFLVNDSHTQYSDWHKQDVARETGQRFLGDRPGEGWQQFNAEFGAFLDDLTILSRYVTVVSICHAKEKLGKGKGEWGGLALSPEMAQKAGRLANWILFKTYRELNSEEVEKVQTGAIPLDEYIQVVEERGEKRYFESVLHTRPYGEWNASMNYKLVEKDGQLVSLNGIRSEEPGDLAALLKKEGLL